MFTLILISVPKNIPFRCPKSLLESNTVSMKRYDLRVLLPEHRFITGDLLSLSVTRQTEQAGQVKAEQTVMWSPEPTETFWAEGDTRPTVKEK